MKRRLISILLVLLVVISIALLGFSISRSRSFQFFGGITQRVETQEKVLALTFDDGPTDKTDEILAILEKIDIKATFYVTGRELEENLEAGRKIAAAGHELGNHTYSHERVVMKSSSYIKKELELTDELIREAGYEGQITFRPPFGKKLLLLPYILKQNNTKTIMWDLEPETYPEIATDSHKIVDHVLENVQPGSIVLIHVMYESRAESVKALEGIVTSLQEQGYSFKTVSELLEYQ